MTKIKNNWETARSLEGTKTLVMSQKIIIFERHIKQ